jgi:hypothetical protein
MVWAVIFSESISRDRVKSDIFMTIFEDYIFIYIAIAHILSHCYPTGNTEEPIIP